MLKKRKKKENEQNTKNLEKKLLELEEENKKNLQGWQRARADYQNLSKEMENLRQEYRFYGQEDILVELIPILNNFDQAIISQTNIINDIKNNIGDKNLLKKIDSWKLGVDYINKQFQDFFVSIDLKEIETENKEFDPLYHEAVETIEDENLKNNIIVKVIKKGYLYKGKILFPSKVVVNKINKSIKNKKNNKSNK